MHRLIATKKKVTRYAKKHTDNQDIMKNNVTRWHTTIVYVTFFL